MNIHLNDQHYIIFDHICLLDLNQILNKNKLKLRTVKFSKLRLNKQWLSLGKIWRISASLYTQHLFIYSKSTLNSLLARHLSKKRHNLSTLQLRQVLVRFIFRGNTSKRDKLSLFETRYKIGIRKGFTTSQIPSLTDYKSVLRCLA